MPSSDERTLQQLLLTASLTREALVHCIISESTKNKPLRTTLSTFMSLDGMKKKLTERDDELAKAEQSAGAAGGDGGADADNAANASY